MSVSGLCFRDDQVLGHPFVIGELACGNLHNHNEVLHLLEVLPGIPVADHTGILHLIDFQRLYGQGLGWIDAHLLASVLLTGCELWTSDRLLHARSRIEQGYEGEESPSLVSLTCTDHRRFKLLQGFGILKVKDNAEPLSQWPPAMSMGSSRVGFH